MINSKSDYKYYIQQDLLAYQLRKVGLYDWCWQDCLRFQLRLRKIEYLNNVKKHNPFCRLYLFFLEVVNHKLAAKLGFTIPKNVFGPGLCVVHYGTIVVSPLAKVGKNCRIHPSTSIGDYCGAPQIGDNVYIGPGAKLFGPITIGNNVAVGANSVVNKSFGDNVCLGGSPASVISAKSSIDCGVYPAGFIA